MTNYIQYNWQRKILIFKFTLLVMRKVKVFINLALSATWTLAVKARTGIRGRTDRMSLTLPKASLKGSLSFRPFLPKGRPL